MKGGGRLNSSMKALEGREETLPWEATKGSNWTMTRSGLYYGQIPLIAVLSNELWMAILKLWASVMHYFK